MMERSFTRRLAAGLVPAVPYLWLGVLFLVPFLIVLKISLSDPAVSQPPYKPVFEWGDMAAFFGDLDLENFALLTEDDLYFRATLSSVRIAAISTALLLLVGFPIAYGMARAPERYRGLLVAAIILPFWTSFLIRIYAWVAILKPEGLLNQALMGAGLIAEPLDILNTETAVYIGIVYAYLPFMVLPLYATLEKMDDTLLEAALDLGSTPWRSFWTITVPLAMPGIIAGSLLCFIPAVGEFVIPDLLGGSETLMIGRQLWSEFFSNRDWPLASAVAILLLVILVVPIVIYRDVEARRVEVRP
ncbi:ABC transporter permease [Microvirga arsenatis]|uniref:ABC transporter permease subunit n=1 Tax=Microvirga arsenatis TaxID=2692265 RepID=A0ABW9YSJ1_9HYPH|nr:ABC transporter permease subunit [Microvirga arsenatis]NBJ09852.1 ABC transporter permease subunit [Microvirga arsenatis]NBJ22920.1 ABC transporter permease subunit [Microvirga arsenatis]